MNNGVPIDQLKIVERLESAGTPPAQAKAQAAVLADVISAERRRMDERFPPRQELSQELGLIKAGIDRVDAKVDRIAAELTSSINEVSVDLTSRIDRVSVDLTSRIDRVSVDLTSRVDRLAIDLASNVQRLELRIDKSAAEVKSELIRWAVSLWILQTGLISALIIKLLD